MTRRRSPLRRSGPPVRKTRLRAVNPERRERLRLRNFGPVGYADWVRAHNCCVSGLPGTDADPVVFAHGDKSRGAGGDWRRGVPMLASLHAEQHALGTQTFQRRHGVDLQHIADGFVWRWMAFAGVAA